MGNRVTMVDENFKNLLNPHLKNFYDFDEINESIKEVNPIDLFFNTKRFDLIIKYVYIHMFVNDFDTSFHKEIYEEHIKAFSNGTFKEGDGSKNNIDDFYISFNKLINSIRQEGFKSNISIIPIDSNNTIIDGSHRLSTAFYFKKHIKTIKIDDIKNYDYNFFINKGLSSNTLDYVAFKYCELNVNAKVVNFFPIGGDNYEFVKNVLNEYGHIFYEKEVYLNTIAQDYVVRKMYEGEHWIGNEENNFYGARNRARIGFSNKEILKIYLFIPKDEKSAIEAKSKIRNKIGKGNYPIHINDTHKESITLVQIYFNENTIHYINNRKILEFEKFNFYIKKYTSFINKYKPEDFCVDASSSLSAYGLREGADLDFLYSKQKSIETGIDMLDCHNEHSHYYDISIDDIIYNPKNHFYYEGLKFVSLEVLKRMKLNRGEVKDINDVRLIETALKKNHIELLLFKLKRILLVNRLSYKWIRTNAHVLIKKDSRFWKITKVVFYELKNLKEKFKTIVPK